MKENETNCTSDLSPYARRHMLLSSHMTLVIIKAPGECFPICANAEEGRRAERWNQISLPAKALFLYNYEITQFILK